MCPDNGMAVSVGRFLCVQTMVWLSVFAVFLCVHTMVWLSVLAGFCVSRQLYGCQCVSVFVCPYNGMAASVWDF